MRWFLVPTMALAVGSLALGGCRHRAAAPSGPPAAVTAPPSGAPAGGGAPEPAADGGAPASSAAFSLAEIPRPEPARGPLRMEGYPRALNHSMSDPADAFGFVRDGSELAYCVFDVCCREGAALCSFLARDGSRRDRETPDADEDPRALARVMAELEKIARDEGLARLKEGAPGRYESFPPAPTGEWAYGADITVTSLEVAATSDAKGTTLAPASLKIGGRVRGEPAVWTVFPPLPDLCRQYVDACVNGAQLNGFTLSPDASEVGWLMYVMHPSHGSSWVPGRQSVHAFAGQIYNDTGMRHHGKKAYEAARDLFVKATYADPEREVFAYNLACALARLGDPRAAHALRHAIAKGGDRVKARARADADFAGMKAEAWFADAVR
ncbi:MAG: hypothetical protein KF782_07805 [Labilithrix sp.]|nr:hypothetical protein [Labilithrix sp.]